MTWPTRAWLTVLEVAAQASLTAGAVRWHIRKGNLPAIMRGRDYLIEPREARRFVKKWGRP